MQQQLKKIHEVEVEILDEIDRVCKQYDIKYFFVGGTLLGAVRHKGFIPWDDDIDIAMLREDYNKFIKVCLDDKVLSEKYFLHSSETDKNYWLPYIKVRKNTTTFCEKDLINVNTHKGIFVDIFPYDNVKYRFSIFLKIRGLVVRSIIQTIFVKKKICKFNECHNKKIVFLMQFLPSKMLIKLRNYLMLKDNNKNAKEITAFCGAYNIIAETLKKEEIFPLQEISFEKKKYPCYKNTNYYLKKIYGDYMTLPKKSNRKAHMPEIVDFNKGECWKTKRH